jgi:hypothetical protein
VTSRSRFVAKRAIQAARRCGTRSGCATSAICRAACRWRSRRAWRSSTRSGGKAIELSPLFHYWSARGDGAELVLLDPRTALRSAASVGICRRELHDPGFDAAGAAVRPSEEAFADAERQRLAGYDAATMRMRYSVITGEIVPACKNAIARGIPVIVAFWMTSAYRAISAALPDHGPPPPEPSDEGHAVVVLGYDDARESFQVKDSRGAAFGRRGHWQMPYSVMSSRLVHEVWALERIQYDA